MCSNYVPTQADIWKGLALHPSRPWKAETWPGYEAPFVRMHRGALEASLGRFGLVPWWTKPEGVKAASRYTYNARSETVAQKPSYRDPWKRHQFCVIPALAFYEPRWDSGKPVRWRIERADREPLAIAGIWERWRPKEATAQDPEEQVVESFSMLTLNADDHELMRQFHEPGEEKRMVAILEEKDIEAWLNADAKDAASFIRPYPAELLTAREEPREPKARR
jgi:putative SOS response-associated peptidase YedK